MSTPERYSVLFVGENNGLLAERGRRWQTHPEHYERTEVVRAADYDRVSTELQQAQAALAAVTLERDEAKRWEASWAKSANEADERLKTALAQLAEARQACAASQSREAKALEELERLKNTRVPQWVMNGACVENARLRNDLEFVKRQSKMIDAPATCGTCGTRYDASTTGKLIDECQCGGRLKSAEADRDQLQAQVGALRGEIAHAVQTIQYWRILPGQVVVQLIQRLEAALAQPAPAAPDSAKDRARLDWLEAESKMIGKLAYGPTIYGERWVLSEKTNHFGATLRAAIDAAMAATPPKATP